jgi:hypothetical protein
LTLALVIYEAAFIPLAVFPSERALAVHFVFRPVASV